jgi:hypothetical protein
MDDEVPEILASYSEEELTADAAVSMQYRTEEVFT